MLFEKTDYKGEYKRFKPLLGKWFDLFPSKIYDELELTLNTVDYHRAKQTVYPDNDLVFRVYKDTPPGDVRVVIIGQDPYPGPKGQAIGRAFACGKRPSASIKKIVEPIFPDKDMMFEFNEIDFDFTLQHWVDQGVFLLNTALTVIAGKPESHLKIGWDNIIKATIDILRSKTNIVWFLWGRKAQKMVHLIPPHHVILTAEHPSFAAKKHEEWMCTNFEDANNYFQYKGLKPINWKK